jgi:hypothetical protein
MSAFEIPDEDLCQVRSLASASSTGEGSVSLFVDEGTVLVVLHGAIGPDLRQDIRDLVDDIVSDAAQSARRPVRVLARDVTEFALPGVWLLLELRRAARPQPVTILSPSPCVREALEVHGLTSLQIED